MPLRTFGAGSKLNSPFTYNLVRPPSEVPKANNFLKLPGNNVPGHKHVIFIFTDSPGSIAEVGYSVLIINSAVLTTFVIDNAEVVLLVTTTFFHT